MPSQRLPIGVGRVAVRHVSREDRLAAEREGVVVLVGDVGLDGDAARLGPEGRCPELVGDRVAVVDDAGGGGLHLGVGDGEPIPLEVGAGADEVADELVAVPLLPSGGKRVGQRRQRVLDDGVLIGEHREGADREEKCQQDGHDQNELDRPLSRKAAWCAACRACGHVRTSRSLT